MMRLYIMLKQSIFFSRTFLYPKVRAVAFTSWWSQQGDPEVEQNHGSGDSHAPSSGRSVVCGYPYDHKQDPTFRQALCHHCFCCGKQITITGPSQEHLLRHHLQTCHAEPRQIIECLVHMIIYRRQHDHLQYCDWCGQTIVTVDPQSEYERLTLQCQFCTKHFTQACNLINHLFHQHGDIAAEAELFQHVLQQRYAPRGCYCMPPVRSVKTTHQCVAFLQLSMMHYNGNHLLSIPISYDARADGNR